MRISTAADIKTIKPPTKGNERHPVEGCPSLYLKVTANGAQSWTFRYRPRGGPRAGADREYTIGDYPVVGIGIAKDQWKELRRRVKVNHEDPLEEIQQARAAPTVREAAKAFIEAHCEGLKSGDRYIERLRRFVLPKIGSMKVQAVEHKDVDAVHQGMRATPIVANRTLSVVKALFDYAIKRGWIEKNPAALVKRFPEQARERYLEDEEVPRLFQVLATYRKQAVADFIRLLLLTGCRKGELLRMTWDDLNLTKGTWTKPTTKTGKSHRVPLSAPAKEVIARQPQSTSRVFPIKNLQNHWTEIRAAADLEDLTLHDLRHSAASFLASDGESLRVIGELLGHRTATTTQRYAHIHDRAARAAAEKLGRSLAEKSGEKVAPMKQSR